MQNLLNSRQKCETKFFLENNQFRVILSFSESLHHGIETPVFRFQHHSVVVRTLKQDKILICFRIVRRNCKLPHFEYQALAACNRPILAVWLTN